MQDRTRVLGEVPQFTRIFWTSLTFLGPARCDSLISAAKVGLAMTVGIIALDVTHNAWLYTVAVRFTGRVLTLRSRNRTDRMAGVSTPPRTEEPHAVCPLLLRAGCAVNFKGALPAPVTTAILVLSLGAPIVLASGNGPTPGFEKNTIALLYGKWQYIQLRASGEIHGPPYRIEEGYITIADPALGDGNDCFFAYNYRISHMTHQDMPPTVKGGITIDGAYRDWVVNLRAYNPTLFGKSRDKAICKEQPGRHPELFIRIGVRDYDYKDEARPNGPIGTISWDQCDRVDEAGRGERQRVASDVCFEDLRTRINEVPTLCDSQEYSAFACAVTSAASGSGLPRRIPRKILSLCVKYGRHDELNSLIYRFGADKQHVELQYPTGHAIPNESFSAVYSTAVKSRRGAAVEVTFARAGYSYTVYNARVAQAPDGNSGGVQISRHGKVISEVSCDDNEKITDGLWGVIRGLGALEKPDRPE